MATDPLQEIMTAALNKRMPEDKAIEALFMPPPPVQPPMQLAGDVVRLPITPGPNAGPMALAEQIRRIKAGSDNSNIQVIRPPSYGTK